MHHQLTGSLPLLVSHVFALLANRSQVNVWIHAASFSKDRPTSEKMTQSVASSGEGVGACWKTLDARLDELPAFDSLPRVWQGWSTPLDNTPYRYILPDEYGIVSKATNTTPPYIEGMCGPITIRILGKHTGPEKITDDICLPESAVRGDKTEFVRLLREDLKDSEKTQNWDVAYRGSVEYFRKHRRLVRGVGGMMGVDMDDHDLTKTKVVLLALAYMWHWSGEKETAMTQATKALVTSGHLQREDHHPEYQDYTAQEVVPQKLFCDRLAVHLQKQPDDGQRGWSIDGWIPANLRSEWREFKGKNEHRNLYEVLDMPDPGLPRVCVDG